MASTVTFNLSSNAQPTITVNHMVYAIYRQSDPTVIVQSQDFAPGGSGHPARDVTFPGLDRSNWQFRLLETLPDGVTVVREMDNFFFVPGANGVISYPPYEVQVDVTPGVVNGNTSFVFDGTDGTPDWRGRDAYPERVGQGTMQLEVQYLWDKETGSFTLLQDGDTFQPSELFNFTFATITDSIAGVPIPAPFSGVMIVENTTVLTGADIGKKIIIKGESTSFQITLPDLDTVTENVLIFFESGIGNHICVVIKTTGSDTIDWLKGGRSDLKIGRCESLVLYKNGGQWRVHDSEGNFKLVGRIISTDDPYQVSIEDLLGFNYLPLDGRALDINDYARLYEYVTSLPGGQAVSFAGWVGDSITRYSLASGGLFHIPDRRDLHERNVAEGGDIPGTWDTDQVGNFSASVTLQHGNSYTGGPNRPIIGNGLNAPTEETQNDVVFITGNDETTVQAYRISKFVLI